VPLIRSRLSGRRPLAMLGVGVIGLALVAGATVATGLLAPRTVKAGGSICQNVALTHGLDYMGAYGTTPMAKNPMAAVMLRNMGNGAAVADAFGDGALDVFVLGQIGHPDRLYRNMLRQTGRPDFVDVTQQAGLANNGGSRVAAFADLNGDGRPDLIVMNDWDGAKAGSPSRVYRNNGDGTFSDVTANSGFAPVGYLVGGLSLADFNHDGLLDVYVSYWTMELGGDPGRSTIKGLFPGRNHLFANLGNFTFKDVTDDVGLTMPSQDSFTSIFADLTGDGWPDLYVAVDHRADQLFVNEGGHFRNASAESGVGHVGNDMGLAVADLHDDGLLDIYATNITDPNGQFGNSQGNTALIAGQGPGGQIAWSDQAPAMGIADTGWGWGTAFTDMNLDGRLDLFAGQGMQEFIGALSPELRTEKSRLFVGSGDGSFSLASGTGCDLPGDQRAVIPFDANRDGAPDLLVTQVGWSTMLLENQTAGQHWLTVDLAGAGAQAAGARVRVVAGGHPTTQVALYGGSYLSGMPMELYFGLGTATRADDVTITFGDGTVVHLGAQDGDRILHVTPAGAH